MSQGVAMKEGSLPSAQSRSLSGRPNRYFRVRYLLKLTQEFHNSSVILDVLIFPLALSLRGMRMWWTSISPFSLKK